MLPSRRATVLWLACVGLAGCSRDAALLEAHPATIVAPTAIAAAPASPPFREPYFPFLVEEDGTRSVSVGDTSDGYLVNASAVLEGAHLHVLPKQRARDLAFGTDEMIRLLAHVGEEVLAKTGRPLWIGNVGRRGGGDIRWSVSHNAGRDADLAFAYVDAAGSPIDPPDLVRLDDEGAAPNEGLRLDVPRTWATVHAVLEAGQGAVQYLFVAGPLRRKLLAHARSVGESPRLLGRAEDVLVEPSGAPHDDHLHLRLYCSARDIAGGCVDTGPVHTWARTYPDEATRAATRAEVQLHADEAEDRRRALERLVLLRAKDRAGAVAARLEDTSPRVRVAASRALGALGDEAQGEALAARAELEHDGAVRVALLHAAAELGGAASGRLLAAALAEGRAERVAVQTLASAFGAASMVPEFVGAQTISPSPFLATWLGAGALRRGDPAPITLHAAAAAAKEAGRPEPALALVDLVDSPDAALAGTAREALARITNRSPARAADPAAWRALLAKLRQKPREAWVATGFREAGYRVPTLEKIHAWELVRALGGPPYVAWNAERTLRSLFAHAPKSAAWSPADRCDDWLRWLGKRRADLRLPKAPEATRAACAAR